MKKKVFSGIFVSLLFIVISSNILKGGDDSGEAIWDVEEKCDAPCPSISCIRGGSDTCLIEDHCCSEEEEITVE